MNQSGLVKIPRQHSTREFLVMNQLVGNIRLRSEMSEDEIMHEIRSVFSWPMKNDPLFSFNILQSSGGGCKSLSIRQVSASYEWTASAVSGKYAKCPIHILAQDSLRLRKSDVVYVDDYDGSDEDISRKS